MEAMSLSQVWGFIATIRSTPPRRPSQPWPDTRTSYQVGSPWILEGKMLRDATGTPMRKMERANISLAEAEPEPFTLANLTTKSLTAFTGDMHALRHRRSWVLPAGISACPRRRWGSARRKARNAGKDPHPWP